MSMGMEVEAPRPYPSLQSLVPSLIGKLGSALCLCDLTPPPFTLVPSLFPGGHPFPLPWLLRVVPSSLFVPGARITALCPLIASRWQHEQRSKFSRPQSLCLRLRGREEVGSAHSLGPARVLSSEGKDTYLHGGDTAAGEASAAQEPIPPMQPNLRQEHWPLTRTREEGRG